MHLRRTLPPRALVTLRHGARLRRLFAETVVSIMQLQILPTIENL
jgi:hypothetical protein